jgi:general secretion pathway protein J
MMRRRTQADRGFTLLEVLVAMAVFGFLIVGLNQGMRFGLAAWDRQARTIDSHAELDAVDRTLCGLIARLDPVEPVGGQAHSMAFTSDLPETVATPIRAADVALLVDAGHRLVLRWTPHLHANRFTQAVPETTPMLAGIKRLDLAYWPPGGSGGWVASWREKTAPALIRVRMVFPDGDKRHWPDIVAVPMRNGSAP